jgi:hypothetical protein
MSVELIKRYLQDDIAHSLVSETQRFVVDFGRPYVGLKQPKGFRFGPPKKCFQKATDAILNCDERLSKELSYVEGYALVPGQMPIHDAWVAFKNLQAVELTVRSNPLEMAFFGVSFSRSEVVELVQKSGEYGFLDYPISPAVYEVVRRKIPKN